VALCTSPFFTSRVSSVMTLAGFQSSSSARGAAGSFRNGLRILRLGKGSGGSSVADKRTGSARRIGMQRNIVLLLMKI